MATAPKKHDASMEQLIAQYKEVYTIAGTDSEGNELTGYYRKMDYETRKLAFALAYKDQTNIIAIGEIILARCYVAGDHLGQIEDVKLEAAVQAAELMNFNESFNIKKNSKSIA